MDILGLIDGEFFLNVDYCDVMFSNEVILVME